MESQLQNTEFRNNPKNLHPCAMREQTEIVVNGRKWCAFLG